MRERGLVDTPSPARHGGCKKRPQPPRRLPSPWTRERDLDVAGSKFYLCLRPFKTGGRITQLTSIDAFPASRHVASRYAARGTAHATCVFQRHARLTMTLVSAHRRTKIVAGAADRMTQGRSRPRVSKDRRV